MWLTVTDRYQPWLAVTDQDWPWLTKTDQNWLWLIKTDHGWPKLTKANQGWSRLTVKNKHWPRLTDTVRKWPRQTNTDPEWAWQTNTICYRFGPFFIVLSHSFSFSAGSHRGPTFQGVLGLVNYFVVPTHLYTVQMVHMLLCLNSRWVSSPSFHRSSQVED